ncbi:hypothetical protein DUI87_09919 [Hirundo rustica rustica]|uniref:Uncharacterized protein n=1 Tax=Hirundo rustica rustica TaxID=333673 RepID=A0A3M0KMD4_HIRRU|nr:hypothetical protein DUI87_09919 [Hirundo rustica rustica]
MRMLTPSQHSTAAVLLTPGEAVTLLKLLLDSMEVLAEEWRRRQWDSDSTMVDKTRLGIGLLQSIEILHLLSRNPLR